MPNHVRTVVKFKNIKSKEDADFILNMIASTDTETDDPTDEPKYFIDFNKIIPEPTTKEECPKEFLVTEDSHIVEREEKPWFDWYKWHLEYWGTKWNAYDCDTIIGKTCITFVFSTAWTFAEPIINRLKWLEHDLDIEYADEDWGSNCGIVTWSRKSGWKTCTESELPDPEKFAEKLWSKY